METVKTALIIEAKRRIVEESIPRIFQCMDYLTEEEVWRQPNENSNSMGILILHLCGNVRQWVLSGACGLTDMRNRDLEFSPKDILSKEELKDRLQQLGSDLFTHLPLINADQLFTLRNVQCYEETIFTMIIHAIEHFSYHTGQIVYYTKYLKDVDTAFYAGQDLSANS